MSAFGRKLRSLQGGRVSFWCPGCNQAHQVRVRAMHEPHPGDGPSWGFNADGDAPTFTPSVLVRGTFSEPPVTPENLEEWRRAPWPQRKVERVCHSFVTDGRIQFLGDCTHALAGQTVDLPDFPGGTA